MVIPDIREFRILHQVLVDGHRVPTVSTISPECPIIEGIHIGKLKTEGCRLNISGISRSNFKIRTTPCCDIAIACRIHEKLRLIRGEPALVSDDDCIKFRIRFFLYITDKGVKKPREY